MMRLVHGGGLGQQILGGGLDHHRQVVLAERRAAGGDVVLGRVQIALQAERLVVGGPHPPKRQVHPVEGGLAIDKAEALGQHHLEGQAQQIVEHARGGVARIVLGRDHRREAPLQPPGRGQLESVGPEAHAAIR